MNARNMRTDPSLFEWLLARIPACSAGGPGFKPGLGHLCPREVLKWGEPCSGVKIPIQNYEQLIKLFELLFARGGGGPGSKPGPGHLCLCG
jgi:hypothetical protein